GYWYFRTQVEDGRRYFWSNQVQHLTWVVQDKDGTTSYFGWYPGNPLAADDALDHADVVQLPEHDANGTTVFRWNLVRQEDTAGNAVVYKWGNAAATQQPTGLSGGTNGPLFLQDIYYTPKPGAPDDLTQYAHHVHLSWQTFSSSSADLKSDE